MKFFVFIFLWMLSLAAHSQDDNIRKGFNLVLFINTDTNYKSYIKPAPYLGEANVLQLYSGETLFIEIEQKNNVISSMKVVKENKNPNKTVEISFVQNIDEVKHKHESMTLKINNPFNVVLKYSLKIFLLKYNKWIDTDVLPVQANLSSFETWNDIITTIKLGDWEFIKQ